MNNNIIYFNVYSTICILDIIDKVKVMKESTFTMIATLFGKK